MPPAVSAAWLPLMVQLVSVAVPLSFKKPAGPPISVRLPLMVLSVSVTTAGREMSW